MIQITKKFSLSSFNTSSKSLKLINSKNYKIKDKYCNLTKWSTKSTNSIWQRVWQRSTLMGVCIKEYQLWMSTRRLKAQFWVIKPLWQTLPLNWKPNLKQLMAVLKVILQVKKLLLKLKNKKTTWSLSI